MRDQKPVHCQAAQEAGRNKTPFGKRRPITPPQPATHYLWNRRRLAFRCAPESRNVKHALEVGLLFEPCPLTSSELGVDQYELWADGLRLHSRVEASSGPRQAPATR